MNSAGVLMAATVLAAAACGGGNTGPSNAADAVPGKPRTTTTSTLETGANVLQSKGPVEKISMYLNGFHAAKHDPKMQTEAHHYCNQVNEDFAQCILYDGNTDDARMMGIEYIVSEATYTALPAAEKAYWHPHNFEILSGQLRMPGLPNVAEKEALKGKMNSYGKTWHTWMTGMYSGENDKLPLGAPSLQWSFNRDGEAMPGMVDARDKRMDLNTGEVREERKDLVALAKPQGGVDAMAGMFPNAGPLTAGIQDNGDPATKAVPTFGWSNGIAGTSGR